LEDQQLILAKMLQHVVLFISLVAVARRATAQDAPESFDRQAFINDHFKVHQTLQKIFPADLPSCSDNFFSVEAVEKELACFQSYPEDLNGQVFSCTPECIETVNFNGIDCEADLIALDSNLRSRTLDSAKNGTMDAKDRELIEAYILEVASQSPDINGTEPGFLSTRTKAKQFFSDERNYALLEEILGTEDEDQQFLKEAKECVAKGQSASPSSQPESSGLPSKMGYTLPFAVIVGLCLVIW